MRSAELVRLRSKVEVGDCWIWQDRPSQYGYGRVTFEKKLWLAHRWVWTILVGPLAADEHLDHLCRVRMCVNPDHLEPVTLEENKRRGYSFAAINARKTVGDCGHDLTPRSDGRGRRCRTCDRAAAARSNARAAGARRAERRM